MHILDLKEDTQSAISTESCYSAHDSKVFHLGLRYGRGNVAWPEDLTHDVFVKFAEERHKLHSIHGIGGWLYRVASNLAVSRLRRERSFWGRVTTTSSADKDNVEPGADVVIEEHQLAAKAMATLATLPAKAGMLF